MIDISSEQVITLTAATKLLPPRRRGARPNLATLYRWSSDGVKGVCLEAIQVGGTKCTSVEALQRFFNALTSQAETGQSCRPAPKLTAQRRKQIKAAERRLAAAGI